jgi:hypothetical protein
MTDDFVHQQINLISHLLALILGFLPNGRTIASPERNGIYRPKRSDKDNQFEKITHFSKSICLAREVRVNGLST